MRLPKILVLTEFDSVKSKPRTRASMNCRASTNSWLLVPAPSSACENEKEHEF